MYPIGWKNKNWIKLGLVVDPGASFDTPGTPGGVSIVEISAF